MRRRAWLGLLLAVGAVHAGAPPLHADAQTLKVVSAAQAFIATLDDAQKQAALFAFTDARQRVHWSNFPNGAFPRSGVAWNDLNEPQRAAVMRLLGAVLSPQGLALVQQQMAADDILKVTAPPDPPNLPPARFGSDNYHVSFVGTPSATAPWMLQFGGHHMALNITVVGDRITLSPSLTGGQPLKFEQDGKPVYIVAREARASFALLSSLTAAQRAKAVISARRIDLVLGPGHDGQTLQPEGVPGSELSGAQQAQLLEVIEARLGMLNADDLAPAMAEVRKHLDATWFAWYGPAAEGRAYFRVTGPTVSIEFAPQDDAGDHAHNIYRDPTNEYGAAWVSLK